MPTPTRLALSTVCILALPACSTDSTPLSRDASTSLDAADAALPPDASDGGIPGQVPFAPGAPWPKFRGNAAQDGLSTLHPVPGTGTPWVFPTGKGVFSSPIVAADGTVYVGSADRHFYALRPDGTLRWSFSTGEIIDSAGLLDDRGAVYFGSGDGHLYALDAATGAQRWAFLADDPASSMAFIRWFEGNVAMGPTGTLYAPNDNFRVYAIDRATGMPVPSWRVQQHDQTWSSPAIDSLTGNLFIGNNNLLTILGPNTFSYGSDGSQRWHRATNGSVAASPLLTADRATAVIGGFDGFVHAYDTASGDDRWSFGGRDHFYASPARLPDGTIIQPGADGTVYALDPSTGAQRWAYDTPEPIRSSPAVDADGNVYVGGGDGRLYVLRPDGTLRWSMQLISADRHNLNASPALGPHGIYLAGESGEVFGIPYDWCLGTGAGASDPRCAPSPPLTPGLPSGNGATVLWTTPYGGLVPGVPTAIDPNQAMAFSLVVKTRGNSTLALIDSPSLQVVATPAADLAVDVSGDRRFFTVVPRSNLTPGADGRVHLHVTGRYLVNPARSGLRFTGGDPGGMFDRTFDLALTPDRAGPLPMALPSTPGTPQGVWEFYRLAAPLPTILPSYNQIGFDSLHYLVGLVEGDSTHAIAWLAGALPSDDGHTHLDPATHTLFPLVLEYANGAATFHSDRSFSLEAMNLQLAFDSFRVSTRFDATGATLGTPQVHVTTVCRNIMLYGAFLEMLGFCNPESDILNAFGAILIRPHESGTLPAVTGAGTVVFATDGTHVTATLTNATLHRTDHAYSVLVVDPATRAPLPLSYGTATTVTAAPDGTVTQVSLALGATTVPHNARVYLMVDTYPAARGTLSPM